MIRPRHPDTLALTTLIHGAGIDSNHEPIASAIDQLLANASDEHKADLYARIQDSVFERDTFKAMEMKINEALWTALSFANIGG